MASRYYLFSKCLVLSKKACNKAITLLVVVCFFLLVVTVCNVGLYCCGLYYSLIIICVVLWLLPGDLVVNTLRIFQVTDSPYVVASMGIMTRMGSPVLQKLYEGEEFVRCQHSLGRPFPLKGTQTFSRTE